MMPSIKSIADKISKGERTSESFVEECLQNIEKAADFNAIISVREQALSEAKAIDAAIAAGKKVGRLAGVPFIAKDNFLTKGDITTAASNMLKDFEAPLTATAVARLQKEGAILVAKANLDAFAHGGSTENSDFGVTKNPHDPSRVPGGSSGGSAAAVALDLAPFALGTDTGGSIRLPASFTGTVGYKPTYGLVSRYGVIAMASSTDVIGPIANSVEDAALVLDVMAGKDELDATSSKKQVDDLSALETSIKGKTFGVIEEYMGEGVNTEVRELIEESIAQIESAGGKIQKISIPELASALAVYYIIVPAEISSNLSRYDGVRFGHRASETGSIDEHYTKSRSEGFSDEVTRRIIMGTYVLSSGYYDAYYKKAQQVRTILINKFTEAFESVDFMLGPVAPTPAFKIGENTDDPLKMYLTDIMTVASNLVGNPAISIPVGKTGVLPVGLQILAKQNDDLALLSVAQEIEKLVEYSR